MVCLLLAPRFHELTTQAPHEMWIAIPNKARAPGLAYPPIRVALFAEAKGRFVDLLPVKDGEGEGAGTLH